MPITEEQLRKAVANIVRTHNQAVYGLLVADDDLVILQRWLKEKEQKP